MARYTIAFVNGTIVIRDELTKEHMELFSTMRAAKRAYEARKLSTFVLS